MTHPDSLSVDWLRRVVIPHDPGQFWMMVSAVGAFILLVVAVRGLRSLKLTQDALRLTQEDVELTKKDMRDRNTREVAETTIRLCREMGERLLPEYSAFMGAIGAKGVALFIQNASEVSFEATEETLKINHAIEWTGQLDGGLLVQAVTFMNHLEVWSMSFTHDPAPADQRVAFEPCSSVFCQMVMSMYPMLLTQRRMNPASGPFQNTVTLFKGWYGKKAQDQLLDQLKRVRADNPQLPPTIGN